MIARLWHGTTPADKADKYLEVLNETGIPDYRSTEGNVEAFVLRRIESGTAHFYTLTFWNSLDAIERFAGSDHEAAKYYPEDAEFLLDLEPRVQHFELLSGFERRHASEKFREIRRGLPRWW